MEIQLYAKDIMSENLVLVRPQMTCEEAANVFRINHLTGAPVVDRRGVLVGVVSITDLMNADIDIPYGMDYFAQAVHNHHFGIRDFQIEPGAGLVADYMTHNVFTANPETTVQEIARLMYQHQIHRVIIVKPHEQIPLGIVTTFDLLKVLAEVSSTSKLSAEKGRKD